MVNISARYARPFASDDKSSTATLLENGGDFMVSTPSREDFRMILKLRRVDGTRRCRWT